MAELKYEIVKELGELSTSAKGWTKEVNMVSWNDRDAKLDIREWSPDHAQMAKGLTFTPDEVEKLKEILSQL